MFLIGGDSFFVVIVLFSYAVKSKWSSAHIGRVEHTSGKLIPDTTIRSTLRAIYHTNVP